MFDGVSYQNVQQVPFLLQQKIDCLISSRWLEALAWEWNTPLRIFWTHDLPPGMTQGIYAHYLVGLTEFHVRHWNVPPDHTRIIGNGVDTSLFAGPEIPRDENKLVWTSNPERGLPIAARIFQEIRKRWPDLELHIYGRSAVYGWGPGDAGDEWPYLPREEHMENVFLHEPLNKSGLAKVLREAWAWYYPSWWPETYCIAALEAQAAGTPVISVPEGGLVETVKGGVLTYDFLNAVSQLRNKARYQKLSEAGKQFALALDWDVRADQWLKVINDHFVNYGIRAEEGEPQPGEAKPENAVPVEVLPEGPVDEAPVDS